MFLRILSGSRPLGGINKAFSTLHVKFYHITEFNNKVLWAKGANNTPCMAFGLFVVSLKPT